MYSTAALAPILVTLPLLVSKAKSNELLVKHSSSVYTSGAVFSACGTYRYLLWRAWTASQPFCSFGMLNPSTATNEEDDPTIRRCISFAKREGAGGLLVWNLFAFRSTYPSAMKAAPSPVGLLNDTMTLAALAASDINIAGWGVHGVHRGRDDEVKQYAAASGTKLYALGLTKDGHPRHPLYLRKDSKLVLLGTNNDD